MFTSGPKILSPGGEDILTVLSHLIGHLGGVAGSGVNLTKSCDCEIQVQLGWWNGKGKTSKK